LPLPVLEDYLYGYGKEIANSIIDVDILHSIFIFFLLKLLRIMKERIDFVDQLNNKKGILISCNEVFLKCGKDVHISIDLIHSWERLYIFLHFVKSMIISIKGNQLWPEAFVPTVYIRIISYSSDPIEVFSDNALAICHNSSVFFNKAKLNEDANDKLTPSIVLLLYKTNKMLNFFSFFLGKIRFKVFSVDNHKFKATFFGEMFVICKYKIA
jgi:hypothetical protein